MFHSIHRWEFKTDGYDLGFGLAIARSAGKPEVLVPVERVNCHMVPEDGTYTCDEPGLCKCLTLDLCNVLDIVNLKFNKKAFFLG